jgi:hypothetical protein
VPHVDRAAERDRVVIAEPVDIVDVHDIRLRALCTERAADRLGDLGARPVSARRGNQNPHRASLCRDGRCPANLTRSAGPAPSR